MPCAAQTDSPAVFAAVVDEPASLMNGDSDCVETGGSLHMMPQVQFPALQGLKHPLPWAAAAAACAP